MLTTATQNAFEAMAGSGSGDAGALAVGLRKHVTSLGLRALAAKAVHVAAAAPERMHDIYDNAAAGWLGGAVFPPRLRTDEPLPISPAFWTAFWELVALRSEARREVYAERMLRLAGELDPRINARMAAAALEFPGIAAATAGAIPPPVDLDLLSRCPPGTLGHALRQEAARGGGLAEPFGPAILPFLRHFPPPLDAINIQVIQSLPLWSVVAGYTPARFDQIAVGGFLMGQTLHHYSALSSAVTLTVLALERPGSVELMLDSLFRGWTHGRETPLLLGVAWEGRWTQRVEQVRAALGVTAFDSPHAAAARLLAGRSTP